MPTQKKKQKQKKFPNRGQWKQFFKVLSKKEKSVFFVCCLLVFLSSIGLLFNFYLRNTEIAPSKGGKFIEGIIGQPRFINPLFLATEDIDRDIVELLFSGLLKYNNQGELIEDLAESYDIKEQGKVYEVKLKDNALWHDKKPLTSDDVVFTVQLIQDPQIQSSSRIKWLGITVEKVSETVVRFRLAKPYAGFLENLTLKIIPKHIFENIAPQDLRWKLIAQKYLVGSGPFQFKKMEQDSAGNVKKLFLQRNELYYQENGYLEEVVLVFFENADDLLKAAKLGEIDGLGVSDPKYFKNASDSFQKNLIAIPRYYGLFFNLKQESKAVFAKEIRQAFAFAINKKQILDDVFQGQSKEVVSPILPQYFGFQAPKQTINFSVEKAEQILDEQGFKINPSSQKREKANLIEPSFTFNNNLVKGSQGADVRELQKCLAEDPEVYPEAVISGYFGNKTKAAVIKFQEKYKEDILTPIGLSRGTGDAKPMTRDKLNELCFKKEQEIVELEFTLTTYDKFPLIEIAKIIQKNLEQIGAEVIIKTVPLSDLKTDVLKERNFEILLFGEALGAIPDPFPYWHSSQKDYPGLNIVNYQSKTADKLLEQARQTINPQTRQENLEEFQEVLLDDRPAIFLVKPDYVYMLSNKVKNFEMQKITEPAKRFSTIENWYIQTKRVWR